MARIQQDETTAAPERTQALVKRVRDAGASLVSKGIKIGHYFSKLDASAIATQRDTKDQLPSRLKAAGKVPQIVTVQARGGEAGGVYLIMPIEKAVEALEVQLGEQHFVPITVALREIGGSVVIPTIPGHSGLRRLRSSIPAIRRSALADEAGN
jgi:hypothetical protein